MSSGASPKIIDPVIESVASSFLLSFIQALLKSSYYDPSHPRSRKAREGIYADFQRLMEKADELTIYRRSLPTGDETIFVEIPPADALEIKRLLRSEQARMFVPKYISLFERKKLVSVSLRKDLSEIEFLHFVEIMAEYSEEFRDATSEQLARMFAERGVLHVTLVFEDEVVGARRKLPWKVELALSRLRKDLRVLPLFKGKTEEELKNIKQMVLQDIIRPFREAHLISRLLGNIDLAHKGVETFLSETLEKDIIELLPSEVIPELVAELVELLDKASELIESSEEAAVIVSNVKKCFPLIVGRLIREHPEAHEVYQSLLERGLIRREDLPREARVYLEAKEITEKRLQNWEEFLQEIETADLSRFLLLAQEILTISQELESRGKYEEIARLAEVLHDKAKRHTENPEFAHVARNVLRAFGQQKSVTESILKIIHEFEEGRVEREAALSIIRGFAAIGDKAVEQLIDALEKSPSATVRRAIVDVLSEREESLPHVLKALKEPGRPWYLRRNLLNIVGNLKSHVGADIVASYLRDEEHRVREAALDALARMGHSALHVHVAGALKDPSHLVRSRALMVLPFLKTVTADVYARAIDALGQDDIPLESKEAALRTFERWGNKKFPDGETVEEKLLRYLEPEKKGVLARLKKSGGQDALKMLIIQTLEKLGGRRTKKFLEKYKGAFSPALRQRAEKALQSLCPSG